MEFRRVIGATVAAVAITAGSTWAQYELQKLLAPENSGGAFDDYFACSVSIEGEVIVVGARNDDNENADKAGSAHVFRYDGQGWSKEAKLLASDGAGLDRFGVSVGISGAMCRLLALLSPAAIAYGPNDVHELLFDLWNAGTAYHLDEPTIEFLADCQDDESWSGSNLSVSADTENYVYGSQCIKAAVTGANSSGQLKLDSLTGGTFNVRGNIGLLIKISDVSKVKKAQFIMYNATSGYYYFNIVTPAAGNVFGLQDDTWKMCWIPRGAFLGNNNPPAWGTTDENAEYACDEVRFWLDGEDDDDYDFYLQAIVGDKRSNAGAVICLDDARDNQYTNGFPELQSRGLKAAVGVQTNKVGNAWLITLAQLREMRDYGIEIVSHSSDHAHMGDEGTTISEIRGQLGTARRWLLENDFAIGSNALICPYNVIGYGTVYGGDVVPEGHLASRAAVWFEKYGGSPYYRLSFRVNSPWHPWDWYNIPYTSGVQNEEHETFAGGTLQGLIDEAIRDRAVICLVFHGIVDESPGDYEVSTQFFADMLDYLLDNDVQVMGFGDWYVQEERAGAALPDNTLTVLPAADATSGEGGVPWSGVGEAPPRTAEIDAPGAGTVVSADLAAGSQTESEYYEVTFDLDTLAELPDSAVIHGVNIEIVCSYARASVVFDTVQFYDGSQLVGDNQADNNPLEDTTYCSHHFGGATDLWGVGSAEAMKDLLLDSATRLKIKVKEDDANGAGRLDHVRMTVLYRGCPEDVDNSGVVDIDDLFQVLSAWGPCNDCPEDLDDSGVVDIDDLFAVLAAWGPCE